LDPPDESAEPTRQEVESALALVAESREQIRLAKVNYQHGIRELLAHTDLDKGLPDEVRERLFAIRGHLAKSAAGLDLENQVHRALERAEESIKRLEPLAAWGNRAPKQGQANGISPAGWQSLQGRADDEIGLTQAAGADARLSLPPNSSEAEARFPALWKDL